MGCDALRPEKCMDNLPENNECNISWYDWRYHGVYIDDIVVKFDQKEKHMIDLQRSFEWMWLHKLKLNPLKCAFGVSAGNFLRFLVHNRGIEVDQNKAVTFLEAPTPKIKRQLQTLLIQINYLGQFISNSVGKTRAILPLLKLKAEDEFKWELEQQEAFEAIKIYLINSPMLIPPTLGRPMKLYISVTHCSIGSMLAQDNDINFEQAIFYLSRTLTDVDRRYTSIKKLCLALFYSCTKLGHYILPIVVYMVCLFHTIEYMLSWPILRGRIRIWTITLA